MKPHPAPKTIPAASDPSSRMGAESSPMTLWSSRAIAVAPSAPRTNWPSPPMLNTPERNDTVMARPVKIRGVAATNVSLSGRKAVAQASGVPTFNASMNLPGSPKAPVSRAA